MKTQWHWMEGTGSREPGESKLSKCPGWVVDIPKVTPNQDILRDNVDNVTTRHVHSIDSITPLKTNMITTKITIFNRRFIFKHGCFSIVIVTLSSVFFFCIRSLYQPFHQVDRFRSCCRASVNCPAPRLPMGHGNFSTRQNCRRAELEDMEAFVRFVSFT